MQIKIHLMMRWAAFWVLLFLTGAVPSVFAVQTLKPFTWTSSDGVELVGLYAAPARASHRVWVLLHGLGSNKEEWLDFSQKLMLQGEGVLIYDARGHGASNQLTSGGQLDYHDYMTPGSSGFWSSMLGDVGSAIQTLKERYSVSLNRVAVGGASLGANVAIVYASRHPEVPALIVLSPGIKYAGIGSEAAFKRYVKRPVFMAASPEDSYAYASVQQLAHWRPDPGCRLASGSGSAHGVHMFKDPAFTKKLLSWINEL